MSARVCACVPECTCVSGKAEERVRESGGVAELGPPGAAMAVLAESGKVSGRLWATVRDRGTSAEREGKQTGAGALCTVCVHRYL